MLERLRRKLYFGRKVDQAFGDDVNIESLSTLQKIETTGKEKDAFYLQTRIRLCAHIAEKDLTVSGDKPRYGQFARELEERLLTYPGPSIASIEWARSILQRYKDKYGL